MIRFGAIVSVVAVAIGLLVAGAVSGDLKLVYVSIGLAALALLMLVVGVAIWRDRVFGGASAPTPGAGPDRYAAGVARPDSARRPEPAAQAEAALAELGGLAEQRKAADTRTGRLAPGAVAARGARLPAGDAADWTADPGPWDRDKREQPTRERLARPQTPQGPWSPQGEPMRAQGRPSPQANPVPQGPAMPKGPSPQAHPSAQAHPSPQGQPARAQALQGQSTRPPVPQGSPARHPAQPDQPVRESAVAGPPGGPGEALPGSNPGPARPEPTPAAATELGPADDPTRLARRLGTAAELSRQPGPSIAQPPPGRTSANPRPADPLTGPPPATSVASGRTRLQKEAAAAAAAKPPVPSVASPDLQAKAASAESRQNADQGETADVSTGTDMAEQPAVGNGDSGSRPTASAEVSASEVGTADGAAAEADGTKRAVSGVDADEATSPEATSPEATSPEATSPEATGADATAARAAGLEGTASEANGPVGGETTADSGSLVSVVPGIARYHLTDCILIRFLGAEDLETMTRQAAEASGCIACRACRPDKAASED